jgi:hypothetical protein
VRRAIAGAIPLIASIVIPATFDGSVYLISLWILMFLLGLVLVLTSEPVKKPLVTYLRRELAIPNAPVQPAPTPAPAATRTAEAPAANPAEVSRLLAVNEIAEELEAAGGVLNGPKRDQFFVSHELAANKRVKYGPVIATTDPPLHKALRGAYRAMDAVNNRGVRRGLVTSNGQPTTLLDGDLIQEARQAVEEALEAIERQAD